MKESLLQKLKQVKLCDIGHIFLFLFAVIPAFFYKKRRPHLWLVCEKGDEARDNGYWFFRYLRENQPQIDAVYAIAPGGRDHSRVEALGPLVRFGSFRHWVLYLAAEINISSQKDGKPNAAVCYLLEVVLGILKNRRVFLQHGVTMNNLPFLHCENAKLSLFVCTAQPEYKFILERFGYPEGTVRYTGFPRFDSLHDCQPDGDLLLILPTWRMDMQRSGSRSDFLESDYCRAWTELLASDDFQKLLRMQNKRAVFCVHRNMEVFEDHFLSLGSDRVSVLRWRDADIQTLIRTAACLITDYSSVSMDFAYTRKPLIYYQFDYDHFRSHHLPEGYFDYARDGFGPVCADLPSLLGALEDIFREDCRMTESYRRKAEAFFPLYDNKNCERTYLAVKALSESKDA